MAARGVSGGWCTRARQLGGRQVLMGTTLLCAAHRRSESKRAARSHRYTQTRAAPFHALCDHQEPTRSAPARVEQMCKSDQWCGTRAATPREGRHKPLVNRAHPDPTQEERRETQRSSARRGSQRTPAGQRPPLVVHPPPLRAVHRRAESKIARAEAQAQPVTRRTFNAPRGPPGNGAERARVLPCHVTPSNSAHAPRLSTVVAVRHVKGAACACVRAQLGAALSSLARRRRAHFGLPLNLRSVLCLFPCRTKLRLLSNGEACGSAAVLRRSGRGGQRG